MATSTAHREVGFTPVYSARLAKWVDRHLRGLTARMEGKNEDQLIKLGLPVDADAALVEARRRAFRFLPAPRMVRSLAVRPSKSDCPIYRKAKPA